METRRRTLTILGAAALLFAILAGIVLWQRAAEGLARYTPVTFLPGFADKAKDAARIEVSGHDGRFAVELTPTGWVLPDRGNYPANFNQVRQTLITLAQLTTIAPKTNRPDWLHYLALDDPGIVLKRELLRIPFYGWYLNKAAAIPIDRGAGADALRRMTHVAEKVLAEGRPILIFPEGTRKKPGAPPDYKPGVAGLYSLLNVACVPVALDSGRYWQGFHKYPGTITLEFLPTIPAVAIGIVQ